MASFFLLSDVERKIENGRGVASLSSFSLFSPSKLNSPPALRASKNRHGPLGKMRHKTASFLALALSLLLAAVCYCSSVSAQSNNGNNNNKNSVLLFASPPEAPSLREEPSLRPPPGLPLRVVAKLKPISDPSLQPNVGRRRKRRIETRGGKVFSFVFSISSSRPRISLFSTSTSLKKKREKTPGHRSRSPTSSASPIPRRRSRCLLTRRSPWLSQQRSPRRR